MMLVTGTLHLPTHPVTHASTHHTQPAHCITHALACSLQYAVCLASCKSVQKALHVYYVQRIVISEMPFAMQHFTLDTVL